MAGQVIQRTADWGRAKVKTNPASSIILNTRNLSLFFFSVPCFLPLMQDTNRISKIHRRTIRHDNLMDIFVRHLTVETQLLNACRHKQAKHGTFFIATLFHSLQLIFRFLLVEHILEHSSINPDTVRDRLLRTPLHIACSRKDDFQEATNIARILIKHGADVNNGVGDENGMHPMHMGKFVSMDGFMVCVLYAHDMLV